MQNRMESFAYLNFNSKKSLIVRWLESFLSVLRFLEANDSVSVLAIPHYSYCSNLAMFFIVVK